MKIEDKKLLKQSFKDRYLNYLVLIYGIIIVAETVNGITTNNIRYLISVFVAAIAAFLIIGIVLWFDYKSKLRNKPKNL